ncbi:MAG TPA: RHS repeat-associated core domain-containing protein, partial [Polyangiaceae bacterium]|nr:RHS repeat-associated core domain-containing protein [Polyangiaceae bacterium]
MHAAAADGRGWAGSQAIGLYYYGARYYDARQGQWISPDPILNDYIKGRPNHGVFQPLNLSVYSYTYNNPVRLTDPNGKTPAAACTLVWVPGAGQAVCGAGLIATGVLAIGALGVATWHAMTSESSSPPTTDAPAPAPGQTPPEPPAPPPPPQGGPGPISPEAAAAAAAAANAANS